MRAFALGAILFVNLAAAADAPPDPQIFAPLDVFKLEWADHPQLSPDGKRVVYERLRFDIMKDRKRSQTRRLRTPALRHHEGSQAFANASSTNACASTS